MKYFKPCPSGSRRNRSFDRLNHQPLGRSRRSAFTLVEIMIVVAIIGLLAAIAIPNLVKARETSQKNACISNLKQIEGAKQTWAIENKKVSTDTPLTGDLYGTTIYIRDEPSCPASGTYVIGAVGTKAKCLGTTGHTL